MEGTFEPVNQAIKNSDWVLCGTGWQTDFIQTQLARQNLGKNCGLFRSLGKL